MLAKSLPCRYEENEVGHQELKGVWVGRLIRCTVFKSLNHVPAQPGLLFCLRGDLL